MIYEDNIGLSYNPTHVLLNIDGNSYSIKTPVIINTIDLYYASILSLLENKHSFEYYMFKRFIK